MAGQRTDGRRPARSLPSVILLATLLGLLGISSGAWARQADPVAVAARVAPVFDEWNQCQDTGGPEERIP